MGNHSIHDSFMFAGDYTSPKSSKGSPSHSCHVRPIGITQLPHRTEMERSFGAAGAAGVVEPSAILDFQGAGLGGAESLPLIGGGGVKCRLQKKRSSKSIQAIRTQEVCL